jgi:hypothetical protein
MWSRRRRSASSIRRGPELHYLAVVDRDHQQLHDAAFEFEDLSSLVEPTAAAKCLGVDGEGADLSTFSVA